MHKLKYLQYEYSVDITRRNLELAEMTPLEVLGVMTFQPSKEVDDVERNKDITLFFISLADGHNI